MTSPASPADRTARAHLLRSSGTDRRAAREALLVRQRAEAHAATADPSVRDGDVQPFLVLGQVPHFRAQTVVADSRRARALETRIRALVVTARADRSPVLPCLPNDDSHTASPNTVHVIERACAHCGGHCCRGGRDHAHLTVATIRRWLQENPEAADDDAVLHYLSHLPPESLEGSCIYHTDTGCALPRGLRADICNRYLCSDLAQLVATLPPSGAGPVFVSTVHLGWLGDGLLIDGERIQLVPLSTRDSSAGSFHA